MADEANPSQEGISILTGGRRAFWSRQIAHTEAGSLFSDSLFHTKAQRGHEFDTERMHAGLWIVAGERVTRSHGDDGHQREHHRSSRVHRSDKLLQCAHIMNIEFNKYHGSSLNKENFIFKTLAQIIQPKLKIKILEEILLCLIRTRTYIRVREINRTIAFKNHRRKQKKYQNIPIQSLSLKYLHLLLFYLHFYLSSLGPLNIYRQYITYINTYIHKYIHTYTFINKTYIYKYTYIYICIYIRT
ncbi:hypothetical protein ALC62_11805 [Cyphomyrmex costatus]|uniref:Uncharacterized protein n=1 Tax=Cyphomyrmex costatus TaxID=456900 RepID=A0A195CBD3_9HYME|nr:hypothetical protein ALC62_11805 [Cyphomyrmex costatus]